jgi:hypothetical protein
MPRSPKGYGVVNQSMEHTNYAATQADEVSPLQGGYVSHPSSESKGYCGRVCSCICSIPLPSLVVYVFFWVAFGVAVDGGRKVQEATKGIDFGHGAMLDATHGTSCAMMTMALLFIAMTSG